MTAVPLSTEDCAWWAMLEAPRDGTKIQILVQGGSDEHGRRFRSYAHEFPYAVMWSQGRWCFASTAAPLFPWQQPLRWRPSA